MYFADHLPDNHPEVCTMSVNLNYFGKTALVETDPENPDRFHKGLSNKESGHAGIFHALLNMFKSGEGGAQVSGLRNKPPSSRVIGSAPYSSPTLNTIPGAVLNTHSVNTLAASALIALSAVSSNPDGLEALCGQEAGMPSQLAGLVSNAAGVCETAGDAGGNYPEQALGALSARFESGGGGPGVIGYDQNGGTSYGTYQISSKAGTMKLFIDYLSQHAPDLAQKLEAAGPANTGSRSGKMPEVWKQLTAADPARFEKLQSDFIDQTLYLPAVQQIADRTGLDISKAPRALQEVLWSTAVQHGSKGAADIFTNAIKTVESQNDQLGMAKLIGTVYDMRANSFASSGPGVRAAVMNRFKEEGKIALAMLSSESSNADSMGA